MPHTDIMRDDITAKPLLASINPNTGTAIYSLQLRFPRIILAEFNTHRAFSRNASSSRAIPIKRMLERPETFVPKFKYNKAGMQPAGFLSDDDNRMAEEIWGEMVEACRKGTALLAELNVHKQWANRPLEWFGYVDDVLTSTDWANWDYLRDHGDAQDEICVLARKISAARDSIMPQVLKDGQWHIPYITPEDEDFVEYLCDPKRHAVEPEELTMLKRTIFASNLGLVASIPPATMLLLAISAARCCRVSYAKHDGEPSSLKEDVERCLGLVRANSPVHASPFEHQAMPWQIGFHRELRSNLRNFLQLRKIIPFEAVKDKA